MNEEQILIEKVNELTAQLRKLTHTDRGYTWKEVEKRMELHKERLVHYRKLWKMGWTMQGWSLPSDNVEVKLCNVNEKNN